MSITTVTPECIAPGCTKLVRAKGLCGAHYERQRSGSLSGGSINTHRDPSSRIRYTASGCWIWMGHLNRDGYGRLKFEGADWLAHRFFFVRHGGSIPSGFQLDHMCRNRACVNPDHLEPVTAAENLRRARKAASNA